MESVLLATSDATARQASCHSLGVRGRGRDLFAPGAECPGGRHPQPGPRQARLRSQRGSIRLQSRRFPHGASPHGEPLLPPTARLTEPRLRSSPGRALPAEGARPAAGSCSLAARPPHRGCHKYPGPPTPRNKISTACTFCIPSSPAFIPLPTSRVCDIPGSLPPDPARLLQQQTPGLPW